MLDFYQPRDQPATTRVSVPKCSGALQLALDDLGNLAQNELEIQFGATIVSP